MSTRRAGVTGRFAAFALCGVLALGAAPASRALTVTPFSVATADGERTGLVARPDDSTAVRGRPLVILLHGHMGSAEQVFGRTKAASPMAVWLDIAEREKLVVVGLDGTEGPDRQRGWNDCRAEAPGNPRTDDVAFVKAVVTRMRREFGIDTTRLFAMGMSNGAMMTFRLALELRPPLAAFAAVCGSMAEGGPCGPPPRPVSALVIAGTDDPLVPFHGGQVHVGRQERGAVVGIEAAVETWRRRNDLPSSPVVSEIPHLDSDDYTHATRFVYGARGGPQVELVRIDGGGHVEPSATRRIKPLYARIVGSQNRDFECADEAWSFFHDKRVVAPAAAKAQPGKPAKPAKKTSVTKRRPR